MRVTGQGIIPPFGEEDRLGVYIHIGGYCEPIRAPHTRGANFSVWQKELSIKLELELPGNIGRS